MRFVLSRFHWFIISIFLAVTLISVLLTQVIVPVHVRGTITTEYVSFQALGRVPNLLALNRQCSNHAVEIRGYKGAVFPKGTYSYNGVVVDNLQLLPNSSLSILRFKQACFNGITITPNETYSLEVARENSRTSRRSLNISVTQREATFDLTIPQKKTKLLVRNGCVETCDYESNRLDDDEILLSHTKLPITFHPIEGGMEIKVRSKTDLELSELDTFVVSSLSFNQVQEGQLRVGVVGGKIESIYDGKSVELYRNANIQLKQNDKFTITNLSVNSGKIKLAFEGVASSLIVSGSKTQVVPDALKYLSSNSMLILLINTIFAVSALAISIVKGINDE